MAEADDGAFTLLIRLSNGQRIQVTIEGEGGSPAESGSIRVFQVKECIEQQDSSAPANLQKLIFKGRILDNDRSLSDYGIDKGATLFMVKSAVPPSAAPPAPAASIPTSSTSTNPTGSSNPHPMMMGNPFGFGRQSQQGPGGMGMPNPEQMQAMLNSPHMQGLLDNPDLLGSMLQHSMQTPQMQELMRNNPELRQLYNDPAMIQQAIQMMRNPQHMQQVMRQQDLAMSQLENMPGGFAALSSMYRNVQEPMMEAQQASRHGDQTTQANRSSGNSDGATGAAMPNPWGSPAPAPPSTSTMQPGNIWAAGAAATNPWAGAEGAMPNPWGAGGMPGMPPPNMDQMMQMLDNPVMSQMMTNMVQNNPDMIRTMLEAQNPMLRQMFQNNHEMANNFIRNMFNPESIRQMMEMQRSMGLGGGMPGGGFPPMGGMPFGMPLQPQMGGMPFGMPPQPALAGGPLGGNLDFSNLLQQFQQHGINGAAAFSGLPAQVPPLDPADRYRNQLQQLYGMGFDDEQANLAALVSNHGNLNRAVDELLSSPPPAPAPSTNSAPASAETVQAEQLSEPENATPKDDAEKKND